MNELQLVWNKRPGGGNVTERLYLDLVVDGLPLRSMVGNPDMVTGMGWFQNKLEESACIDRLLLREPADTPSGRRSLLVCPECGDLGCGAVSALITKTADAFVWSDFVYENDRPDAAIRQHEELGPLHFEKTLYWEVLNRRQMELAERGHQSHGRHGG